MDPRLYSPLPGTGLRRTVSEGTLVLLFFAMGVFALLLRGGRVRLWQGPDHILEVESHRYRERYARLYYADVQAIILRKTRSGFTANMLLGLVMVLFVVFALAVDDFTGRVILAGIAAGFALLLVVNTLRGPTCECHLQTAVQTRDLCSLNRLATARKVIDRLAPLIEAAQRNRGDLLAAAAAPVAYAPAPAPPS